MEGTSDDHERARSENMEVNAPSEGPEAATADEQDKSIKSKSKTVPRSGSVKSKEQRILKEEDDHCPVCEVLPPEQRRKKSTGKSQSWVCCETCDEWFHWACVNSDDSVTIARVANWYCPRCIESSKNDASRNEPLSIKLKETPRKSARRKAEVKYTADTGPPAGAPNPWRAVAESRPLVTDAFPPTQAKDLTLEWLENDPTAFTKPIFIEKPDGLDMKVLPNDMKVSAIAKAVGVNKPIDVIDVASQSGLDDWTLGKWAAYYEDPDKETVRNVISLELSSSSLKNKVVSPKIVRDVDWVANYWPQDLINLGMYPQVIRYCLMSPGLSWTDWHVDFSASSVFYHILRGSKVFYFISPTAENLRQYEIWSGNSKDQQTVWLGDRCDKVYKVELEAGNTMIIPSGWIHCVYTPTDALVIGGNFLHSYNIATQLRVYQIELNTKVPKKFRFPYFVPLLWYVGHSYFLRLQNPQQRVCRRVLRGLKALAAFLIQQAWRISEGVNVSAERRRVAHENIPWQVVENPAQLANNLRFLVYRALGEPLPPPPADGIPTFDAQDFLDDAPQRVESLKRKASDSVPDSSAKVPKHNHFASNDTSMQVDVVPPPNQNQNYIPYANGAPARPPVEQLTHIEGQPSSHTTSERRKRPKSPTVEDRGPVQDVTVNTTTSESVTKRMIPGAVEGSWVVETRKVITILERVYYPPMLDKADKAPRKKVTKVKAESGEASSPKAPKPATSRANGLNGHAVEDALEASPTPSSASHINGQDRPNQPNGHPLGETARILASLSEGNGETSIPSRSVAQEATKEEISEMVDQAQFDAAATPANAALSGNEGFDTVTVV